MSTIFYLVRHAIKAKGVGDVPLSPDGVRQALATAKHFSGIAVDAIFTSPLRRAKETAAYVAAETKKTTIEDVRLRERANWGDLPGQTFDEFVAMWEKCTRDRDYLPPAGDSARQAGQRLSEFLLELADKHPDGNVVMVTHGGLMTDFLVNIFSEEVLDHWHPKFISVQSQLVPECSITKIIVHDGAFDLAAFASVEHLNLIKENE